jgi:hypothetical protein
VEERKMEVEAILSANSIPIAMEIFPASGRAIWKSIQGQIEMSDVFLLIIGSRYGSLIKDENYIDISCVESEYNIAKSLNKPILVFMQTPSEKK